MKITNVEAIPLGERLSEPLRWGAMEVTVKGGIIVRVDTDEGLTGIGEAGFSAEYFPTVGPVVNRQLSSLLVGEDPLDIGRLWQRMYATTHMWGRRGIETYALSGVDIALWDILGKSSGQPVHRLLGSQSTRVRAYFAPSLKSPERIVDEVLEAQRAGFTAVKLRVGLGVESDVKTITLVRDAVGDDMELMVDANMAYDLATAKRMAPFFEGYGISWLEEPVKSHSLVDYADQHAVLGGCTSLRLAGGESLLTRYEYIDLLCRRIFDVLQPDCVSVGGVSEAKKVADMASAWNIDCVPHIACSSGTGVGLAAGLQVICASGNAPLVEFDAYKGPGWEGLLREPIEMANGYVEAPEAPGIGVEIDDSAWETFQLTI